MARRTREVGVAFTRQLTQTQTVLVNVDAALSDAVAQRVGDELAKARLRPRSWVTANESLVIDEA